MPFIAWITSFISQQICRKLMLLPVVVSGIFILCSQGPFAFQKHGSEDSKNIRDWLVVPVFYATNRSFIGKDGDIAYSEEPNGKGLLFGVKNIMTPVPVNSPLDKETQVKMLWQSTSLKQDSQPQIPRFDSEHCNVKDKTLTSEEIVPAFSSYIKQTGSREGMVFVHGCCATFETSMKRAAKVAAHMQMPVLLYDWVSPEGFRNYLKNETRVQQTMDNFCRFLANLENIADPGNVILLGHSMGAQFVDQAMVRRCVKDARQRSASQFKEIILSNADLDARSFLNHAREFVANARQTRIIVSKNDNRLDASAIAHGDFNRLGAPGALLLELTSVEGAQIIDITEANTGHELPFWVIANMHKYGNLGPVQEFQLKQITPTYLSLARTAMAMDIITKPESACHCNE